MLKEFLLSIRLVKYGLQYKLQLALTAVFAIIGILIEWFYKGKSFLGGFYFFMSAIFIFQLIISMDTSTLIQSSSKKRSFQLRYPYIASAPFIILVYTISVIILAVNADYSSLEAIYMQSKNALGLALALFFTTIYLGLCYKYMIASSIAFVFVMIPLLSALQLPLEIYNRIFAIQLVPAIILGYVIVIGGIALSYLFARLLYRKPLSELAFKSAFSKRSK